jgi:methyl-accepting chemotaxis protein
VNYVEQVSDMVARIATAVEQQAATSNEVTRNMENIATVRTCENIVPQYT